MLQHGGDPSLAGSDGVSPMDVARRERQHGCLTLLEVSQEEAFPDLPSHWCLLIYDGDECSFVVVALGMGEVIYPGEGPEDL